jgi:hypothetical protein
LVGILHSINNKLITLITLELVAKSKKSKSKTLGFFEIEDNNPNVRWNNAKRT